MNFWEIKTEVHMYVFEIIRQKESSTTIRDVCSDLKIRLVLLQVKVISRETCPVALRPC